MLEFEAKVSELAHPNALLRYLNRLEVRAVERSGSSGGFRAAGQLDMETMGEDLAHSFRLTAEYPPVSFELPDGLPEELWEHFETIRDGLANGRLAGFACRSAVEQMSKRELGTQKGNLADLIQALVDAGRLAACQAEWAHAIRKVGNKAVHEERLTPDEVALLVDLVRVVAELLYTYPARVKRILTPGL